MIRRLLVKALRNKQHIVRLISNLFNHIDCIAETGQLPSNAKQAQQTLGVQRDLFRVPLGQWQVFFA